MSIATGSNDLRFDWSSAINQPNGDHRRDFIFSVGTDPTTTGQFIMSASNNAPGWPSNPGRDPFTIDTSGWYTLRHTFYDAGAGVLAVNMSLLDSTGTVLHAWTLSDPSDIIGSTVGGNRYGWLVYTDFATLALDNITRTSGTLSSLGDCTVTVSGSNPTVYTLVADCTTDQTILVPQSAGGSVFDGNGDTITGVDPTGGNFLGAVVQAQTGANLITVKNLTVTVSNLKDACDDGNARLRGILFDNVSGTIVNNKVMDLEQGTNGGSGCQEGNAIEVRNAPFTTGGVDKKATISGNVTTDYQKTGIVVNGSVAATIVNNQVTGDGPISYIAQNGIQVVFGAVATVTGNVVSGNSYTGLSQDSSGGVLVVGGSCFGTGLGYAIGSSITKNTLTDNDIGIWLYNADASWNATTTKTNNAVKFNVISNDAVTNTSGHRLSPARGYQAGVADVGHKDLIVNNTISGVGYTPQVPDCGGTPPAFLRHVDTDSSARGAPSNK